MRLVKFSVDTGAHGIIEIYINPDHVVIAYADISDKNKSVLEVVQADDVVRVLHPIDYVVANLTK